MATAGGRPGSPSKWRKGRAAAPPMVTAEVRVPPEQSLTIQPGVEVLFQVYCKLIVDNGATLRAVGTPGDSIRFDLLPPNLYWHGIRFLSASDSSRLEYCILAHGYASGLTEDSKGGAIYIGTPVTVSHCSIANCSSTSGGGIFIGHVDSGVVTVSDCSITNNSASYGGGLHVYYCSAVVNILNCEISGNSAICYG